MINILANDGISQSGKVALENAGFNISTITVAQEQLIKHIQLAVPSNSLDCSTTPLPWDHLPHETSLGNVRHCHRAPPWCTPASLWHLFGNDTKYIWSSGAGLVSRQRHLGRCLLRWTCRDEIIVVALQVQETATPVFAKCQRHAV